MISLSVVLAAVNLYEPWRAQIRETFLPSTREILAKATGDLTSGGRKFLVLKVKTQDSINLEVYEHEAATGRTLFRSRTILPERRDGMVNYRGNATNLLLVNLDKDLDMEIIAPTFDENLVPRVHVYKFNESLSTLDPISPDNLKL